MCTLLGFRMCDHLLCCCWKLVQGSLTCPSVAFFLIHPLWFSFQRVWCNPPPDSRLGAGFRFGFLISCTWPFDPNSESTKISSCSQSKPQLQLSLNMLPLYFWGFPASSSATHFSILVFKMFHQHWLVLFDKRISLKIQSVLCPGIRVHRSTHWSLILCHCHTLSCVHRKGSSWSLHFQIQSTLSSPHVTGSPSWQHLVLLATAFLPSFSSWLLIACVRCHCFLSVSLADSCLPPSKYWCFSGFWPMNFYSHSTGYVDRLSHSHGFYYHLYAADFLTSNSNRVRQDGLG